MSNLVDPSMPSKLHLRIEIVEPMMAEILRPKTEGERLCIGWGMWRSARNMIGNVVRAEHRDWSDAQIEAVSGSLI